MSKLLNINTKNKKEKEDNNMSNNLELVAKIIYRERRFPVQISEPKATRNQIVVAAKLIDDITKHNFVAGKELMEAFENMSATDIKLSLEAFINAYKKATGDYVNMNKYTMYQDYPNFVVSASMEELLYNQCLSYITQAVDRLFDTKWHKEIFEQKVIDRGEDDKKEYEKITSIILRPGTVDDALRILKAMMASRTNLFAEDQELLKEALDSLDDETFYNIIPKKIPQKTTLKLIASIMIKRRMDISVLGIKNSVDAIRLAHELSGSTKIFKLKNAERMAILDIINKDNRAIANMHTKREDFLRLGEHIHPKKYAKRFPNAAKAFDMLRSKEISEKSIMSQYNSALEKGELVKAATILKTIPGKFVQELDYLLSLAMVAPIQGTILDIFEEVADKVPSKRLYQAYIHFKLRCFSELELLTKYTFDRYSRPIEYLKQVLDLPFDVCQRARDICYNAFKESKKDMQPAKYYINKERFSKAVIDKVGSRFSVRDTDWLRLFCYWIGQDIDLTAVFLDEEFNYKDQVSWQRLRTSGNGSEELLAYHSEDITYAPKGGAEYIDINRAKAKELVNNDGYRYIAIINVVYSGPAFHNLPDAFIGVTSINNPGAGEVFKPHAVEIKSKIKGGRANLAFLYDILEDEIILVNSDITPENSTCCTVSSCFKEIVMACNAVTTSEKYNMYKYLTDLINVTGGTIVENKEDADVVFDTDGIDIFDDVLYSEYV